MAKRRRLPGRPPDLSSIGEGLARPGMDPRLWNSFATVAYGADPVTFDPERGPLVRVVLHPSEVEVTCRVLQSISGNGEGDWYPFVSGDEVLVAIPEGNARAGCVIIGRLPNSVDRFPSQPVAGQDPTKNACAFRKQIAPQILECDGPIVARHAPTGALAAIDQVGAVTLRDGNKNAVQLSADAISVQSGDGKFLLQWAGARLTVQVGDAIFVLSSSDASPEVSALVAPGPISISAAAQPAAEHVATTEAVASILVQLGIVATVPWTSVQVAAAIQAAAATGLDPIVATAIVGAFAAATQKPAAVPGLGQVRPGIGCSGLAAG